MMLVLGGGAFAFKTYKGNRPHPVWVPLELKPHLSIDQQTELAKEMKEKLLEPARLTQVSKDLNLTHALKLPTDAACAEQLAGRIFVRIGERVKTIGKVPTLDVGVTGKRRERELSEKIALRLTQEVIDEKPTAAPEF